MMSMGIIFVLYLDEKLSYLGLPYISIYTINPSILPSSLLLSFPVGSCRGGWSGSQVTLGERQGSS